MGGGLDGIHPRENTKLAEEIVEKDGALVSEQLFGVPPSSRNLVQRNRLQSGISMATVVVQTDIKGGSMHTVRFAIQQNRLLVAPVPLGHHAAEPKNQGILAMTQFSANQFADAVQADGGYRRILVERYHDGPVAMPLASKGDHALMLELLETRFSRNTY